jgi:hypothetical protein
VEDRAQTRRGELRMVTGRNDDAGHGLVRSESGDRGFRATLSETWSSRKSIRDL